MKLNADIIYHELQKNYRTEMTGPKTERLELPRPEFYMEEDNAFLSDHLYRLLINEAALLTFSFGLLYMFFSVLFEHGSEERFVFAVLGVLLICLGTYIVFYEPFK